MLKDERMSALCDAVRRGVTVCDVGTDHATIPIELILSGKSRKCIITDISAQSLKKGVNNAKKAGCERNIEAFCTNGTLGVPLDEEMDIIIAGMGGELIAQILDQDERLKNVGYRFALQPMSKAEELRDYLSKTGFHVIVENKVMEAGRIYPVIVCSYSGRSYEIDICTRLLGFKKAKNALELEYARKIKNALHTRLSGLKNATVINEKLITELQEQINEIEKAV